MSKLPEEIIVEILSRLPVKSLLRFRCVSNPWRTLISSPNFAKLHLKRTSEHNADIDHHSVLISSSNQVMNMNFNPSPPESYGQFDDLKLDCPAMAASTCFVDILGSCNGLIFLCVSFEGLAASDKYLAIWNPSTRNCKVLPKPRILLVHTFAFYGFGFDATIDDFKVVSGGSPFGLEVFTLKTNTWTRKGLGLHTGDLGIIDMEAISDEGTLVNGALHWLKHDCATILSFDLAQEQFCHFVSLPDSATTLLSQKSRYTELGFLQGCLCFYTHDVDFNNGEVWVMKEYGVNSSWSKLFSIFIPSALSICSSSYIKPLCILKSGEVLLYVDGWRLQTYNPKDNTLRTIRDSPRWMKAVVYVESLVSLMIEE